MAPRVLRGSSKTPGLSQLGQLYHHLLPDSDLHNPPSRATCLPRSKMTCASKLKLAPCNTGL